MNCVERPMETRFSQLTAEREVEIKKLGPYQTQSYPLAQVCGKTRRTCRFSTVTLTLSNQLQPRLFRETVESGWITHREGADTLSYPLLVR